ncbi:MAG: hypothetical protein GX220_08825 [Treponema sp.]|nr:hypothetical protein [Treponema sp.]
MKKFFLVILIIFALEYFSSAVDNASFRTALRYAQVARSLSLEGKWTEALEQTERGLAYEKNFSDLLYLKAYSLAALGEKKYLAIDCVKQAVENNLWREINPDSARILYANYMSDTNRSGEALKILDSKPAIFSSDAEFIRAKSNYRLGNFSAARKNISTARKVFTGDERFALLFFQIENPYDTDVLLAKQLVKLVDTWKRFAPEILIYASHFVDEEEQKQMLLEFEKINKISLDYIIFALETQLKTADEALNLFATIGNKNFKQSQLEKFYSLLIENTHKEIYFKLLNNYSGIVTKDYSKDYIEDFYAYYENGQLIKVEFFEIQDDFLTFEAEYKNNEIIKLDYSKYNMNFEYSKYPDVSRIKFETGEDVILVPNEIQFKIIEHINFQDKSNITFIFPEYVFENAKQLTFKNFINNVAGFKTTTDERVNGTIHFTVLNGQIITANYYSSTGNKFAYAAFENGLPLFRNVDNDMDGRFEVTEFYSFDEQNYINIQTEKEQHTMGKILFGTLHPPKGLYLSKVVCDLDGNSINDYFEIYKENNTKVCGWDIDDDGVYDIGFSNDAQGNEEIFYRDFTTGKNVYCVLKNHKPVLIKKQNMEIPVTKDDSYEFYWIGKVGKNNEAKIIMQKLNSSYGLDIFEIGDKKIFAFKVNGFCFGEIIDEIF